MPRSEKGAYDRLKARVFQDARRDLERANPEYVEAFQATLLATAGDLDDAIAKAKPLLKGPLPKWPKILTGFFDLELVRGKVVECHAHLKQARDDASPNAGYWFSYHLDHWTFQTDAFLERCNRLYTQVIRGTIRERDPDGWQSFQKDVVANLTSAQESVWRTASSACAWPWQWSLRDYGALGVDSRVAVRHCDRSKLRQVRYEFVLWNGGC